MRDESAGREFIERWWQAAESRDWAALRAMMTDDFVMEWPQSGERFRGPDNAIAAVQAQQESPEPASEPEVEGSGNLWLVRLALRYGDEVHHYVGIFRFREGRVASTTEYFAAPFPAREFRAQYAEGA